jgi:8-oxo-dGTP pyrophosphatase MutT (NUDIX family)
MVEVFLSAPWRITRTWSGDIIDYEQSGVVPYRRVDGQLEVLLITSRRRGRWIIPKGLIEPDMSAAESASIEAFEEAGVRGRISDRPVDEYRYEKWGGVCRVKVFLLEVDQIFDEWLESDIRKREWMTVDDAVTAIEQEALKAIVGGLPDRIA